MLHLFIPGLSSNFKRKLINSAAENSGVVRRVAPSYIRDENGHSPKPWQKAWLVTAQHQVRIFTGINP